MTRRARAWDIDGARRKAIAAVERFQSSLDAVAGLSKMRVA